MPDLLRKIAGRIRYGLNRSFRPQMQKGYRLADGTYLGKTRISNTTVIDHPENLRLGDNVFIYHYSILEASNGLTIGEGCQIGGWVGIFSHSSHISIRLYGREYQRHKDLKGYIRGPVAVGECTFIGPHSVIMPNTVIGKGCIVAAHSYLNGKYPDFSIIGGNPAKVIGDTRKVDRAFINKYPELQPLYDEWAGQPRRNGA